MTDNDRRREREPWQRFTLLDLFLLQASFAVAFSVIACSRFSANRWGVFLVGGTVLGCVFAAPIVLLPQYGLKGRRTKLSAGEVLWLLAAACPVYIYAVGAVVTLDIRLLWVRLPLGAFGMACILLQVVCAMLGLALLSAGHRDVPCRWTDRFGCWVAMLLGLSICVFLLRA